MYPYRSLVTLSCLASISTAAVFPRRDSANQSGAPYANSTVLSLSAAAAAAISILKESPSPSLVQDVQIEQPSDSSDLYTSSAPPSQYAPTPSATVDAFQPSMRVNATSIPRFVLSEAASSTVPSFSPIETPATGYANATAPSPIYLNGTSTRHVSNATCTINIPNASVNYWYPPTYSHVLGTMTTAAANFSNSKSYTLVPHTTTFDAASAFVSDYACTSSSSYISAWDWTQIICVQWTGAPDAATTSLVYRSAAAPWPTGGLIAVSDALDYDLYSDGRPSATAEITLAPNATTYTETSATPVVFVTAYEVETGNKTETIRLRSPQAYPYEFKGLDQGPTVTGPLPPDFLDQIPQSACDAGQLQAVVTVLVVVDLYYENLPNNDPLLVHFESSVLGFEDETVGIQNTLRNGQPLTVADWSLTTAGGIQPNMQASPTANPDNGDNMFNNGGDASMIEDFSPEPTQVTIGTIGGTNPVVIGPSSQIIVGSQTLRPGGPAITVGDTPVSLAPSGTAIVVGGTTSRLPQVFNPAPQPGPRPPPVITIGSSTLVPNAATQFFIAPGQTLTAGGVATVDGTVISLAPSASFVVVGRSTQSLPVPGPSRPLPTDRPQIIVGGSTIVAEPSVDGSGSPAPNPIFIVSGQTLAPGGPAITVSGTTISLAPSASFAVINGVTSTLVNPAAQITAPPLTIGNMVFTAIPDTKPAYIISSMLLTAGGFIVVSGVTISLSPSATALIINGQTSLITAAEPIITNPPLLTIGAQTYTAADGSGTTFVISGQTLVPGGTITVDGTTIVLKPGATELVYGSAGRSTTTALFPATTTRSLRITGTGSPSAGQGGGGGTQPNATQGSSAAAGAAAPRSCMLVLFFSILVHYFSSSSSTLSLLLA